MALTSGTKLGPYEIVAPLGAGGMGEVYRARDTRLDRTVAIKVLAPHLAADPDLRERFEQVLRVATDVADALERAHRAGMVHRDLKPSNIVLTKAGAKLLDFGLAKM